MLFWRRSRCGIRYTSHSRLTFGALRDHHLVTEDSHRIPGISQLFIFEYCLLCLANNLNFNYNIPPQNADHGESKAQESSIAQEAHDKLD